MSDLLPAIIFIPMAIYILIVVECILFYGIREDVKDFLYKRRKAE